MAKGYTHFAVQNTAECWSDVNAKDTYDDLGSSDKCNDGVGLKGGNMVYHLNGKNVIQAIDSLHYYVTIMLLINKICL